MIVNGPCVWNVTLPLSFVRSGSVPVVGWISALTVKLAVPSSVWLHTDPDRAALREHRARFPALAVERCSVERLPLANESTDGVSGLCVLDLVADLELAVREMRRILAPGGRVVQHIAGAGRFRVGAERPA